MYFSIAIFIPFNPAIDMQIDRPNKAIGFLLVFDFDLIRIIRVIQQFHLKADQGHGRFIQFSVKGNRAIFGNTPPDALAEVIFKIRRCHSKALHLCGKAFERCLAGSAVFALMVDLVEPDIKGFIELYQRAALKSV